MHKTQGWYSVAHSGAEYKAFSTAKQQVEKVVESDKAYIDERSMKFREKLTKRVHQQSQQNRDELSAVRDNTHTEYMVYLAKAIEKIVEASRAVLAAAGLDETTIRTRYKQQRCGYAQTGTQTYFTDDKRGRFEVWTPASTSPLNIALHSLPKPGEIVIRHVKKDGSDALTFDTSRHSYDGEELTTKAREWRIDGSKHTIRLRECDWEEVPYEQVYWPPKDEPTKGAIRRSVFGGY